MKSVLYTISQTPYSNNHSFELLESAMVGAIFDLKVSILYREDGVWSLVSKQNGDLQNTKTYSKVVSGLSTYEIDRIYFCEQSVEVRRIDVNDLFPDARPLKINEQKELISRQDIVMAGPK